MSLHVIHFIRSIDQDALAGLQNTAISAIQQKATEIRIHLSSNGGNADQSFATYHFLRSLPVPLEIQCIGNVESMAVVMFLAADKRTIVPHGKIKIHPMHWNFTSKSVDHNRLLEYADSLNFDAERYANIFEERTGRTSNGVNVREHLAGKAKLLTAEESVNVGIATEISEVEIPKDAVIWWV